MPHGMRWIYKALVLTSFLTLSACALFEERAGPQAFYGPRDQVYFASFEEVWKALNLVVQPYPLRVSNMDQGTLETDMIRGQRVWSTPYKAQLGSAGDNYKLVVHVLKGASESHPATKVTIVKETQRQVDFFSDPRALPSDGLEEKSILYRIGREIQIDRALTRAQKKKNQAN